MKKVITSIILFIFIAPMCVLADSRVAMLISGYANKGNEKLTYDLEELAQSYLVLTNNGLAIDIVSPEGGKVIVHNKKDDLAYIKEFKQQTPALQQLNNTLSARQALANEYDALFIVGGDGAMFDLPFEPYTQQLISKFVHKQKPIAAVCHGPAALVNIKLDNGEYFLKGKKVNSFTLLEEHAFSADLIDQFPFMLQPTIEKRGALFVSNQPMLPFVAEDGLLITAQNPMSVAKAAEALLVKLEHTPKARKLFKDEATLQLISRARAEGAVLIDIELARDAERFDLNYLALYGFYAYKLAQDKESKLKELTIMAQVGRHFSHPQYALALTQAYVEQGLKGDAEREFKTMVNKYPKLEIPDTLETAISAL